MPDLGSAFMRAMATPTPRGGAGSSPSPSPPSSTRRSCGCRDACRWPSRSPRIPFWGRTCGLSSRRGAPAKFFVTAPPKKMSRRSSSFMSRRARLSSTWARTSATFLSSPLPWSAHRGRSMRSSPPKGRVRSSGTTRAGTGTLLCSKRRSGPTGRCCRFMSTAGGIRP
jgi:hypothetical protein